MAKKKAMEISVCNHYHVLMDTKKGKIADIIVIVSILAVLTISVILVLLIRNPWPLLFLFLISSFAAIFFLKGSGIKTENIAAVIFVNMIAMLLMKQVHFILILPALYSVYLAAGAIIYRIDNILKIDRTFRCPKCGSENAELFGHINQKDHFTGTSDIINRWRCGDCQHLWEDLQS